MKDIKSAFIPFMTREVSDGHRSSQLAVTEVKQYLSTDVNMMDNGQCYETKIRPVLSSKLNVKFVLRNSRQWLMEFPLYQYYNRQ